MKKRIIVLFIALLFILSGCTQSNVSSKISTNITIQKEIESSILSNEYSPSEIEMVLLTSLNENTCCIIHTSWSETTSLFLTECYYAIPIIKEILNTYECNSFEIEITSKSDSEQTRSLTYKSDDDIFLLDSSGSNIITQRYTYEQLNIANATQENSADNAQILPSVESNSYDICGEVFHFSNSVKNDVTGNWRISLISSSKEPTEYAVDYYNTLFSTNDEIHAIVNFTLKTTTRISVLYEGMLDVTVLEYVDGEEHDAKELFSGMVLSQYWINTETGEIEQIQ